MKSLKSLVNEAIDADFAEKKLRPWSSKVAGMSGPSLEYVKTLEAVLSFLAPTSAKTNAKFDRFVKDRLRREKSASKLSSQPEPVGKLPDSSSVDPEMADELPNDPYKPASMTGPTEKEPIDMGLQTEPPPLPKSRKNKAKQKQAKAMPTLKTVASKSPVTKKKNIPKPIVEPEEVQEDLGAGLYKIEAPSGYVPSGKTGFDSNVDAMKLGVALGNSMAGGGTAGEEIGRFKYSRQPGNFNNVNTNQWYIGGRIKLSDGSNYLVIGGSRKSGWIMFSGGSQYLFIPSASPRAGRGLYKLSS